MDLRKIKLLIEVIIILMTIVFIWQAFNNNLSEIFGTYRINIYVGVLVILGAINLVLSYVIRKMDK